MDPCHREEWSAGRQMYPEKGTLVACQKGAFLGLHSGPYFGAFYGASERP